PDVAAPTGAPRPLKTRPADSNTFRCDEIVGCVNEKRPTRSDTDASPRASCTTIPRRVGSARAANAWSSRFIYIEYRLYRSASIYEFRIRWKLERINPRCAGKGAQRRELPPLRRGVGGF